MSIFGLYYFVRLHPYWSKEGRRQLGRGGVLTIAIAHIVFSLPVAVLPSVGFLWFFLLITGFIIGTGVGLFLCLQWRIIHTAITRRSRFPRVWLFFQLLGLALVVSAIFTSAREGRSVLDGVAIYFLVAGVLTIVTSAILHTPRETEPNQPPQRNAGIRPSSDDSPASETPSSLGPRG
jgi:hypothetical protein